MFSCKRCCRKCFPNGCCGFCKPSIQVKEKSDTKIHVQKDEKRKDTPYGYIHVYPGVRTSDSNHTCPVLSVHLYYRSEYKANMAKDKHTIIVDNNNQQQAYQGPQQFQKKEKNTAEEEVRMLPIEDVIGISFKTEMKQGIQADVTSQIDRKYEDSENCCDRCYDGLLNCCRKTRDCCCCCCRKEAKVGPINDTLTIFHDEDPNKITTYEEEPLPIPEETEDYCTRCCNPCRCWCCRKKKLVGLIKRTKTVAGREAQRVVTITIECIPYSNLDAASNPHLLNSEQKLSLYKDQFKTEKLEFYLVNSTEFDAENFRSKLDEAELLCKTVMHLKGMKDHYPSDNQLMEILGKSYKRTFGDELYEPILQLSFNSSTTRRDPQIQEPQRKAIPEKQTTT